MAVPQNEPTLSPYQQRIANLFNGNTFRRSCGKKRFTCTSLSRNISEFPALEDYLPKNYDYHVCDFDLIRETGDHVDFKTTFRMVLSSKEDIKLWMKSHAVTWRVDRTYVTKGQKVIFKVDYRCQRNTRPRRAVQVSGHSKNTDCPAMMCVKLFRTQVSRGRQSISTDSHLPTFPTMVSIMNEHNHNIGAPESLPCLVSDIAEYELEVEIGDDYAFAVADGTLSPTPEFSYGWLEDPGAEVVVEDVEQNASEEASHQMAALEFDAMCQKLSEIVKSDESFAAPAAAAVNAFKKIERNPFRIAAALRTFARDPNAGSPSAKSKGRRGAARGKAPSRGRRRLAAERPAEVCAGLDHVYSQ
ncbi:uncharacterized protein si:dkey-75a21.2 [Phyllopteryx taeniolatus]|uniref:uncharacterized protein si:dkey-75a21.2 n=1 Tax=Phyllopteryx taeniolatus TaxID=161469 RepID=UPI002AD4B989|nr:uncharacterized protein si:dkey-75a21.2 [Phyllopteryx taeniolatus]XP_061618488.1 uncharacterized protein si:dkey-75a21.2 [Phyllopteryx taeniolatus]XP_061618489.1 uncharacterized protein si:dkey-75a21.2 [Phyllopteryx taeniolatus]XP_061618491.1 uncharacterized protein si:dkey-75a21.2 [Phyllopteryx taeniolatus]XP_061618492.1 uncharacterized protein si:dkey-75a21.2 [Phyllopteryx taeniolatus]